MKEFHIHAEIEDKLLSYINNNEGKRFKKLSDANAKKALIKLTI